jgi:hypothetical protein
MNSYPQKLSTGVWTYRNTALNRTYTDVLDTRMYAGQVQAEKEREVTKENDCYSFNDKKTKIKKRLLRPLVSLSILIASFGATHAEAASNIDHLKLYAHTVIIDYKQTRCFYDLVTKESRWNPKAKNGSHYGLIQMKNERVRYMNPYAQIDMGIAYLQTRYGSICNGYRHLLKHGWQ